MTVRDLILESNGISKNVFKFIIEIARISPSSSSDQTYAKSIILEPKDHKNTFYNEYSFAEEVFDFVLLPYDIVTIRPDPNFKLQKRVYVGGQVKYPGDYTILSSTKK